MDTNKGLTTLAAILIVVGILVIAGGAYYYFGIKKSPAVVSVPAPAAVSSGSEKLKTTETPTGKIVYPQVANPADLATTTVGKVVYPKSVTSTETAPGPGTQGFGKITYPATVTPPAK